MTVDYPHIPKSFDTITPISADLADSTECVISPVAGDRCGSEAASALAQVDVTEQGPMLDWCRSQGGR